jgi:hypothetical protein
MEDELATPQLHAAMQQRPAAPGREDQMQSVRRQSEAANPFDWFRRAEQLDMRQLDPRAARTKQTAANRQDMAHKDNAILKIGRVGEK